MSKAKYLVFILSVANISLCTQHKNLLEQAREHKNKGNAHKAITCYQKAINADSHNLQANLELALEYYHIQNYEPALEILEQLSQILPNNHFVFLIMAKIYHNTRIMDKAIENYKKVIKLNPDDKNAYSQLGYCYLTSGDYKRGHEAWSARSKNEPVTQNNAIDAYDGKQDLHGKTILMQDEGGFGDLFQWIRFARELKHKGANIVVQARKAAIPLLSYCQYIDKVIPQETNFEAFDYKMHVGTLFHINKMTLETIPTEVPYLYPNKELVKKWQNYFKHDNNFKIGICWDPQTYRDANTGKLIENTRAIPLFNFYEISQLENVSIYSLQQKNGLDQLAHMPSDFNIKLFNTNFDCTHGSFMDTAAAMQHLDLIITADTSIGHLAGALGVKVWTLLPFEADWRWMLNRSDSPWYPTMRLFRQKKAGQWGPVLDEVINELHKLPTIKSNNRYHY